MSENREQKMIKREVTVHWTSGGSGSDGDGGFIDKKKWNLFSFLAKF